MNTEDLALRLEGFLDSALSVAIRVVVALLVLFISFRLIRLLVRRIERAPRLKKVDKTVSKTLLYTLSLFLKGLVVLALISYVGIDTGGITALIASLGVGIGLAVNGTLSNMAGGFLIIVTRPFRIDDFIEAQGYEGTVEDIRIVCTKLRTPDNKVVYIPNGQLSGGNIVNYSEKELRRLDLSFPITNGTDLDRAKALIDRVVTESGYIINEPPYSVRVRSFGESGVELFLRAWLKSADYWTAYYDITEGTRESFVKEGIQAPERHINVRLMECENDKNRREGKN